MSDAIGNIPVPGVDQPDTYEISVVTFARQASIDVANFLVSDANDRTTLATNIYNLGDGRIGDVYIGGLTNYEDAFVEMLDALDNSTGVDFSYVNFATDGEPTMDNLNGSYESSNNPRGIVARNNLLPVIDNLSIEGIGGGVDASNLQNNYCFPGPCDTTDPYNFPTQGFYIGVANAQGYADAIGNKVLIVTGQAPPLPVPGTIALLGLGLAGLASLRRKRIAA